MYPSTFYTFPPFSDATYTSPASDRLFSSSFLVSMKLYTWTHFFLLIRLVSFCETWRFSPFSAFSVSNKAPFVLFHDLESYRTSRIFKKCDQALYIFATPSMYIPQNWFQRDDHLLMLVNLPRFSTLSSPIRRFSKITHDDVEYGWGATRGRDG